MLDLENFIQSNPLLFNYKKICVAFSGGIDSHVLLHNLVSIRDNKFPSLILSALHINHGLYPQASTWETHCSNICKELKVDYFKMKLNIKIEKGDSIEERARIVRYDAFRDYLENEECLVTAHHADDQVETAFFRLIRGSGVRGLCSIRYKIYLGKGTLIRPLLNFTRVDIESYAQRHNLQWIQDSSNEIETFDRNYLRKNIVPLIKKRWPKVTSTVLRAVTHFWEAEKLLQDLAEDDLKSCELAHGKLKIPELKQLTGERFKNLFRFYLLKLDLPVPSTKKLEHIIKDVIYSKNDRTPSVNWKNVSVKKSGNVLYLLQLKQLDSFEFSNVVLSYQLTQKFILPNRLGIIKAYQVPNEGLNLTDLQNLTISFRKGGEKIKPKGSQYTKLLKKLFNEWRVPVWERNKVPLLFYKDTLISVIGYCICENYAAKEGQVGWVIMHERKKVN